MILSNPLIIANWKMGVPCSEARGWVDQFEKLTTPASRKHAVILPSFLSLSIVRQVDRALFLGSQDCSAFGEPAHTGSIPATDIKEIGCQYALIGHSERRRWNGETDELIHAKVIQATAAGLTPILCIGEDAQQRKIGKTKVALRSQLRHALQPLPEKLTALIVAYEPVWAIGGSAAASPTIITETHRWIRQILDRLPIKHSLIVYGGAVDEMTLPLICQLPNVNGVLVGRASWKAESFSRLVLAVHDKGSRLV
ncbi:triosephosphate isomerase [Candidatus Uhrbacteria bacterium]|nr:triosephosphate isomerase [Candidatus Uhrbacteria bacterium]